MIKGQWYHGAEDISDAKKIREDVFIKEQLVDPDLEWDGEDAKAEHIVVYDGPEAVGTGRLVLLDDGNVLLGRIAVKKDKRGQSYGDFIVRMMVRKAFDSGAKEVHLHAQISAQGFYSKLGFEAYGDEYMEANIPHINMKRLSDFGGCCGH